MRKDDEKSLWLLPFRHHHVLQVGVILVVLLLLLLLLRPSVRATPPPSFRSRWREGGGDGAIKGERQFPSS